MATHTVDPTGQNDNLILTVGFAGYAVLAAGGIWTSLHVAAWLDGTPPPISDPLKLTLRLFTGRQAWSSTATEVAAVLAVVLLVHVFGVVLLWPKSRRMRPDRSAGHMGRGRDLDRLTAAGSAAKAKQLGSKGPTYPSRFRTRVRLPVTLTG